MTRQGIIDAAIEQTRMTYEKLELSEITYEVAVEMFTAIHTRTTTELRADEEANGGKLKPIRSIVGRFRVWDKSGIEYEVTTVNGRHGTAIRKIIKDEKPGWAHACNIISNSELRANYYLKG